MSLKALAGIKVYRNLGQDKGQDVDAVFHSALSAFLSTADENIYSLSVSVLTLSKMVKNPKYGKLFLKNPMSLPNIFAILKNNRDCTLNNYALTLLKTLVEQDNSIRPIYIKRLELLACGAVVQEDGFPAPAAFITFLKLIATLLKEPSCADKLATLVVKSKNSEELIPIFQHIAFFLRTAVTKFGRRTESLKKNDEFYDIILYSLEILEESVNHRVLIGPLVKGSFQDLVYLRFNQLSNDEIINLILVETTQEMVQKINRTGLPEDLVIGEGLRLAFKCFAEGVNDQDTYDSLMLFVMMGD